MVWNGAGLWYTPDPVGTLPAAIRFTLSCASPPVLQMRQAYTLAVYCTLVATSYSNPPFLAVFDSNTGTAPGCVGIGTTIVVTG